jgi:hypothetical protein
MGKVCEGCGMTRWENRQVTGWVDATRAENERLRGIIGGLYVARGGSRWELYAAIRRAFHDMGGTRT